jgi:hypothetical protein
VYSPDELDVGCGLLIEARYLSLSEQSVIPTADLTACWRHACMGTNPPVMAALHGDVDSGWRAAR